MYSFSNKKYEYRTELLFYYFMLFCLGYQTYYKYRQEIYKIREIKNLENKRT
jgi:hypothetical protein